MPRGEASARADKYICREIRTTISSTISHSEQGTSISNDSLCSKRLHPRVGEQTTSLNLDGYNRAVKTSMVGQECVFSRKLRRAYQQPVV